MNTLTMQQSASFVLDSPKLTRLVTVLRSRFTEADILEESYTVNLARGREFEITNLEEVLDLDNSERDAIRALKFSLSSGKTDDDDTNSGTFRAVVIHFDSVPGLVTSAFTSGERGWSEQTLSLGEEQIERTLQRGFMFRLARRIGFFEAVGGLISLLAVVGFLGLTSELDVSSLQKHMYLSDHDVAELRVTLRGRGPLTDEQVRDVLSRQVQNVLAYQSGTSSLVRLMKDWRIYAVSLPLVVALGAFLFLLVRCYPKAEFAWGDGETRHARLLQRRRFVWQAILGALGIAILMQVSTVGFSALVNR